MQWISALWLPIILTAVLVFVASSLIHMVFKWHQPDYRKFPNEDEVRGAIRAASPPGGQYLIPHCASPKDMQTPEMQKKYQEGPIAFVTLRPLGEMPSLGKPLGLWFAYNLAVAAICGYVAAKSFGVTPSFWQVCRLTSGLAFLAYAGGALQMGIWMGKPMPSVVKEVVLDAAIYATITGLTFAYFWPK